MTKLTTERLEEIAKLEITEFSNGMDIAKDAYQSVGSSEIVLMARQLLAYEQAAKNPVAWVVGDEEIAEFKNGREVCVMRDCDDEQLDYLPLYAAPVLPKQPELIGMKVSIDTGSDNIGHRLFGEIVGTSDSNGVPVLCIEVAENNADVTLADEGKTAKIVKAAEKLVRCKGRYHSEQNYRALAALFGVTVPDLPPLPADEAPAQPVSEPYKLNGWISVDEKMPEDGGAVLVHQDGGIIFCAEAEHGWFYPDEFPNIPKQGREITHWMPLPAAPAQDSE